MAQANPFDQFDNGAVSGPAPDFQYKGPQAAADVQHTNAETLSASANAVRSATQNRLDVQKAPGELTAQELANQKAALEIRKAQSEQAQAPDPMSAKIARDLQTDNVLGNIQTARDQVNQGYDTGNVFGSSAFQYVPLLGQNSSNLAATLSGVKGSIINDTISALKASSANGASGYGSLTETEADRLAASVAALQQTQDRDSLLRNLAQVDLHYRNAKALLNNEDPRDPNVAKKYGIMVDLPGTQGQQNPSVPPVSPVLPGSPPPLPPAGGAGGGPGGNGGTPPSPGSPTPGTPLQLSNSGYQIEADPALQGVNAHIRGMIQAGAHTGDIVAYMNTIRPGLGDARASDLAAATAFRAQHPNVPIDQYTISVENRQVPLSPLRSTINAAAQSPVGTGIITGANAVTAGAIPKFQSNPALAQAGITALGQANPKSAFAGTLAGGALAGAGLEGLGAAAGLGRAAPIAADAIYGGTNGYLSGDGSLNDTLKGAAIGTAGGMFGRRLVAGAGNALTGVRNDAVQYLRAQGVPMTAGQMVSQSGRLGARLARREDRLAGFSGIGDAINDQRIGSLQGFNRAMSDQALAPAANISQYAGPTSTNGVIGEEGVNILRNARGQAYNAALDGVNVTADQPFVGDMRQAIAAGQALPEPMRGNAAYTLPTRVGNSFDPQGNLTGHDYQQALRGLRRDASSLESQPYGWDFGNVTRQAEGALSGLLDRQAPGVVGDLNAANALNRNVEVVKDAVNRARNGSRSGETGLVMPSQLSDAAAANARRFGGTQGTTDQPFFELSRAGQQVLPSRIPDSGTAGRLEQEGGLRAAARALVRNTVNAPLYSDLTQPAIARLLLDRPDAAVNLGNTVGRYQRLGGMFGRPLALMYTAPGY